MYVFPCSIKLISRSRSAHFLKSIYLLCTSILVYYSFVDIFIGSLTSQRVTILLSKLAIVIIFDFQMKASHDKRMVALRKDLVILLNRYGNNSDAEIIKMDGAVNVLNVSFAYLSSSFFISLVYSDCLYMYIDTVN